LELLGAGLTNSGFFITIKTLQDETLKTISMGVIVWNSALMPSNVEL
jgi:hypothetical protein